MKKLSYLRENIEITELSNFKTKAFTKYYFEINKLDDVYHIWEIYEFAKENDLKILFVWSWTNMLFSFYEYNGIIIKNNLLWYHYDEITKILTCFSWEKIRDISEKLEKDFNQDLFHRFIWLPWSVWWAVFWNAWCFWLEIENNLKEVLVYDIKNKTIITKYKKDINFSYRNSIFKQTWNYFIIKIVFDLSKKIEKYHSYVDNIKFRKEIQPIWNSCWSFFKNPSKDYSAWFLIEDVWLKWFSYNNAYFSDKHRNFLMTYEKNWNHKDLLYLIDLALNKIKQKHNIVLENEVRIIKN